MNKTIPSDYYLQKELKSCRYQLSQAERKATAACESRDALVSQLENATDKVAELQRTLNVAVRNVCYVKFRLFAIHLLSQCPP
jgi:hypothetical protein